MLDEQQAVQDKPIKVDLFGVLNYLVSEYHIRPSNISYLNRVGSLGW